MITSPSKLKKNFIIAFRSNVSIDGFVDQHCIVHNNFVRFNCREILG